MTYRRHSEGSMFMYEAAAPQAIDVKEQYHAVQGYSQGTCAKGVSFLASANGVITDTADNGSGKLRVTDVGHSLTTGQYVTLTGMGDVLHVGSTVVTVISVDVYDAEDISWNSDSDTGNWQRGSSLTIDPGHGGDYDLSWSVSLSAAGANKDIKFELVRGTDTIVDLDEFASARNIATANDLGSMGSSGIVHLHSGDTIWLQVENITDAADLVVQFSNIKIKK